MVARASSNEQEMLAEAIVAAILTTAVLDSTGCMPNWAVKRYTETLQALRQAGGPFNPSVS